MDYSRSGHSCGASSFAVMTTPLKYTAYGGGDRGRGAAGREDEKNYMAKSQDENGQMCGDSYEMRIGKMSKHDTMIDR